MFRLLHPRSAFVTTSSSFKTAAIAALSFTTVSSSFSPNRSSSCLKAHFMSTTTTTPLSVTQFSCLGDNYGYLLHDPVSGNTVAIDTPDAAPYQQQLNEKGWTLTHIWNTHHHHDHTGGNLALKETRGNDVHIVGPASETIPGMDQPVKGGDKFSFGSSNSPVQVIDVGGHTKGHVAYYLPEQGYLFAGDSLFALGCGRMFEGTPGQFWDSLKRLRDLPDDTVVYWCVRLNVPGIGIAVLDWTIYLTDILSLTAPTSTRPPTPNLPSLSNRAMLPSSNA